MLEIGWQCLESINGYCKTDAFVDISLLHLRQECEHEQREYDDTEIETCTENHKFL